MATLHSSLQRRRDLQRYTTWLVRYLVSKKADMEATAAKGPYHRYTALMVASLHGNLQVVRTLLEEGAAIVNYCRWRGETALYLATAKR